MHMESIFLAEVAIQKIPFSVALLAIVKNDRMIGSHWAWKHIALKYIQRH